MTASIKPIQGFTLLEILIAIVLLSVVVVPLIFTFRQDKMFVHDRDRVTAMCLIDQEAEMVRVFPRYMSPVKRKTIAGQEWEICCEKTPTPPEECRISVKKNGREISTVTFLVYCDTTSGK
jgi:prepilin-type N-terminal cleavage/methylation domain-containing protein